MSIYYGCVTLCLFIFFMFIWLSIIGTLSALDGMLQEVCKLISEYCESNVSFIFTQWFMIWLEGNIHYLLDFQLAISTNFVSRTCMWYFISLFGWSSTRLPLCGELILYLCVHLQHYLYVVNLYHIFVFTYNTTCMWWDHILSWCWPTTPSICDEIIPIFEFQYTLPVCGEILSLSWSSPASLPVSGDVISFSLNLPNTTIIGQHMLAMLWYILRTVSSILLSTMYITVKRNS